jgi:hypothetical protein
MIARSIAEEEQHVACDTERVTLRLIDDVTNYDTANQSVATSRVVRSKEVQIQVAIAL